MNLLEYIDLNQEYFTIKRKITDALKYSDTTLKDSEVKSILNNSAHQILRNEETDIIKIVIVSLSETANNAISGLIGAWKDSSSAIHIQIFIPKIILESKVSLLTEQQKNDLASKIARTFSHELLHMIQYIRSQKNLDGVDSLKKRYAKIQKSHLSNWDEKSLKHRAENDYYSQEEKDLAKSKLYLSSKMEVPAHALNAAQELVDYFGSPEKALEIFKQKNGKMLRQAIMSGEVPHMDSFRTVTKYDISTEKVWKMFLKQVYKNIKEMKKEPS